MAIATTF
jgi:hypothetical protein